MYDTEAPLYRHYRYIKKENSLYARWFQRRGLSYPLFLVLDEVMRSPEGAEPTEIADALGIPKQTVTGLLDRLERAGYARRERFGADRRRMRVFVLPEGKAFLNRTSDELEVRERAAIRGIDPDDMETFNKVYAAIVAGLEKHLFTDSE